MGISNISIARQTLKMKIGVLFLTSAALALSSAMPKIVAEDVAVTDRIRVRGTGVDLNEAASIAGDRLGEEEETDDTVMDGAVMEGEGRARGRARVVKEEEEEEGQEE